MEGEKSDMAARRQVTNKLRGGYRKASKSDKGRILDQVVAATGVGRSTARRLLTGPRWFNPTAVQRQIQALADQLQALVTAKAGPAQRPRVTTSRQADRSDEATKQRSRTS